MGHMTCGLLPGPGKQAGRLAPADAEHHALACGPQADSWELHAPASVSKGEPTTINLRDPCRRMSTLPQAAYKQATWPALLTGICYRAAAGRAL